MARRSARQTTASATAASRRHLAALGAVLVAAGVLLAGCGGKSHPQTTFDPHGSQAREIQNLIDPVFVVAGVVFVLVIGGVIYMSIRFRSRSDEEFFDDSTSPAQVHGAFKLEIGWTIVPALLLLIIGVFTVGTIFNLAKPAPPKSVHVQVIGQQWWWEYRYDLNGDGKYDDITTANDLVIPEGVKVQLTITARDVIHSFWIPAINGKKDAVPNHNSPLVFQADKVGHEAEYVGQCTEYCGLSHANMRMKLISLPAAQFADWAANQQKKQTTYAKTDTSLAAQGQQYFLGAKCSSCHVINGVDNQNFAAEVITAAEFGVKGNAKTVVKVKIKNTPGEIPDIQVSGAAPNLTHLMTRTTFAGALFDLRLPTPACKALGVDWATADGGKHLDQCLNVAQLKAWLRNPPKQKPMAPEGVPGRTGPRGMPNLNLTEGQIDQLVAYLKTLK